MKRKIVNFTWDDAGFNSIETYKDFEKTPATPQEFSNFLCRK